MLNWIKRIKCRFVGHDIYYGEKVSGMGPWETFKLTPDICQRCWLDEDHSRDELCNDWTFRSLWEHFCERVYNMVVYGEDV